MTLSPGTRLGPYEIVAPLGAGGMGEVYRAKDTRLGREVAIKVLPEHLSANEEIRARFEREAKTVSSLNHPNICTLFDVGREGQTDYLVMELVEGETLAQRLRKGPMAGAELLRLGAQIADALDRAHRAGVIHRDLKPGNVMLARSGAKLMDFGLARAADVARKSGSGSSGSALTQSPTVGQSLTTEGTLVGTFQYMAPEQLEGREADVRSDIWALGCVLYEMASGKRAFEGRSQATLIAAIISSQPAPLAESPSGAPPSGDLPPAGLDRLVRACLAKDPEDRVQSAHAVKQQLQWIAEGAGVSSVGVASSASAAAPAHAAAKRDGSLLPWAVAALALLAGGAAVAWLWPRANAPRPSYRFRTERIPGVVDSSWPRVSPDGRLLVFTCVDSTGMVEAWVRPLDQPLSRPILGSKGLARPYWSPDGREIAFIRDDKMLRLAVTGGEPRIVCEARGADLSWGSKGYILMDGLPTDSLQVVPARGGELQPAARIARAAGELGCSWPFFLPDGEHFLYIGFTSGGGGNMRLGRLGSLDSKLLGRSDGRVEYAPGGWVLYLRGTTLLAQKLDLGAGKLTGEPLTVAQQVREGAASGHFSISPSGVLAYARDDGAYAHSVFEADRGGRPRGSAITSGPFCNPALSPDGQRLLLERGIPMGNAHEIWVRDLQRNTETKLTFGGGTARMPVWSPDGRRFACVLSRQQASASIVVGAADGLGSRDSIAFPSDGAPMLSQWSEFGSRLLVCPSSFRDIRWVNPDSTPREFRPVPGINGFAAQLHLTPDGRWATYTTAEVGGRPQVFVQSLTGTPGRWQVSTIAGYHPMWTRGGREILYESPDGLMAVAIDTRSGFHAGTPVRLFTLPIGADVTQRYWTSSSDGTRFFLIGTPHANRTGEIEVVTDFASLVNRK